MSESALFAVDLVRNILPIVPGHRCIFIIEKFELPEASAGKDNTEDGDLLHRLINSLGFSKRVPGLVLPSQR